MRRKQSLDPDGLFKMLDCEYALSVSQSLHQISRTGWVDRGVRNPETIGEHVDELLKMAEEFYPNMPGLSKMLIVHDWPKSDPAVGDRRTDSYCSPGKRLSEGEEYSLGFKAMKNICQNLDNGEVIMRLWTEFKKGTTVRSEAARQLTKLQTILQAIKYQRDGQPVSAKKFINHDSDKVKDFRLKMVLQKASAGL